MLSLGKCACKKVISANTHLLQPFVHLPLHLSLAQSHCPPQVKAALPSLSLRSLPLWWNGNRTLWWSHSHLHQQLLPLHPPPLLSSLPL